MVPSVRDKGNGILQAWIATFGLLALLGGNYGAGLMLISGAIALALLP